MTKYEVSWVDAQEIQPEDQDKACTQVYVWLVTKDDHVLVVSKDGENWQLPGGKPDPNESLKKAAVREVNEETGIDISGKEDELRLFGYRKVDEIGSVEPTYIQARYLLELNADTPNLGIKLRNEDTDQPPSDLIKFVGAVTQEELVVLIPWLEDSPELATAQSLMLK